MTELGGGGRRKSHKSGVYRGTFLFGYSRSAAALAASWKHRVRVLSVLGLSGPGAHLKQFRSERSTYAKTRQAVTTRKGTFELTVSKSRPAAFLSS